MRLKPDGLTANRGGVPAARKPLGGLLLRPAHHCWTHDIHQFTIHCLRHTIQFLNRQCNQKVLLHTNTNIVSNSYSENIGP